MSDTLLKVAKAAAFVIWADGKAEQAEFDAASKMFAKLGLDEKAGLEAVKNEIDNLVDLKDEDIGDDDEIESDINLGDLSTDDIETADVLECLVDIALADGVLEFKEIDVISMLGSAMKIDNVLVMAILLKGASKVPNIKINVQFEKE